ncbi:TniQ family protein [Mesobacillus jeotgali]|uniref:TniQ family protein n=1 Tax=Mesobacillus jeotgali TaxID=129985 RepID=A0ABY9VEZ9_9BACI|nr:TniQ family protein [Mesobacillus jeotgali]WNF22483.1 TniQ family protein [Mesobacillus jeotgali]
MHENLSGTPRSILYNLKPIGIGTEFVESLTSYLTRIAFEHTTTVGHLVNKLLVPTMDKDYLLRSSDFGGNRFYEGAKTLNGYMENSYDMVYCLKKLTRRIDLQELTLLKYKNVIPLRGLFKKALFWCSCCIKEWVDNRKTIYYPLIWYLEPIKVCHIHSCYLVNTCPSCHERQDILRRQSIVGLCQHCNQSLGGGDQIKLCDQESLEWQNFVFLNISTLLTNEDKVPLPLDLKLVENLNLINDKVFNGAINQFSQKLKFARNTISGWLKGDVKPTIDNQLYICYQLTIGIEQLLFKNVDVGKIETLNNEKREVAALVKVRKQLDNIYIQKQLEEIIQGEETISMEVAAKRVGINKRTLYRNFGNLCIQISNQYKHYLEERKHQRIVELKDLLEKTFINLYQQGIYPSRRKMEFFMNKQGVLKERILQKHWQDLFIKHKVKL